MSGPRRIATLMHGRADPDVSWGNGRGCPLVVHYWVDLHWVHGFNCYDNISLNAKCQRVLVLAVCLVAHGDNFLLCRRTDQTNTQLIVRSFAQLSCSLIGSKLLPMADCGLLADPLVSVTNLGQWLWRAVYVMKPA